MSLELKYVSTCQESVVFVDKGFVIFLRVTSMVPPSGTSSVKQDSCNYISMFSKS